MCVYLMYYSIIHTFCQETRSQRHTVKKWEVSNEADLHHTFKRCEKLHPNSEDDTRASVSGVRLPEARRWATCHANARDRSLRNKQSNKQDNDNRGQKTCEGRHTATNWIRRRARRRETLFICCTKKSFIIHNSLYAHFVFTHSLCIAV